MIFVFIGGASAAGKTALSEVILQKLLASGVSAQMLSMDDYYREHPENVDLEAYRQTTNFDTPNMIHLDLFRDHVTELSKGHSITKPLFSFKDIKRCGEQTVHPSDVVIIEGIFAQYFYKNALPEGLTTFTANVASDTYSNIIERRIKRDVEHRGRTRIGCIDSEKKYVGPGFLKYIASSATGPDMYIDNEFRASPDEQHLVLEACADKFIAELNKKRAENAPNTASKQAPNVQEMVAQSHFIAGTLPNPRKFEGYFPGVFGSYKGNFVRTFSEQEPAPSFSSPK